MRNSAWARSAVRPVVFVCFAGAAALGIAAALSGGEPEEGQRERTGGAGQLGQLSLHLAPSVYWPLAMGNKWTYGTSYPETDSTTELVVKRFALGRAGGGATATLDTESFRSKIVNQRGGGFKVEKSPSWDPWTEPIVVKVDDTGIYWISDQHGTFNPPVPIFKSGTKHGDEWKWAGTVQGQGYSHAASATVLASSVKVKTPMLEVKEHDALKVMMILEIVINGEKSIDAQTCSFVPRIGPVTFGYSRQEKGSYNTTLGGGTLIEYSVR